MSETAMTEAINQAIAQIRLDLLGPEIILVITGCLALVVDWMVGRDRQHLVGYATLVGVIGGAMGYLTYLVRVVAPLQAGPGVTAFSGLFVHDAFAVFFKYLFLVTTTLVILLSMRYLEEERAHHGEYYSVLCFATVGMMIMVSARDLILIFVGLELMALSIYMLVGFLRSSLRSNEAAMKYFILGAFSSGFLVYGISLFYGVAGSTSLDALNAVVAAEINNPFVVLGLIMMSVGLAFKVAAVPFHAWAPDVYEGAPTPITIYVSVASKSAAFAILLRILLTGLYDLRDQWTILLTILAVATMVFGNVVAVVQTNVKRMLAYSSIAHAGYALIGVLAAGSDVPAHLAQEMGAAEQVRWLTELQQWAQGGVLMYLLVYMFMNVGAFGLVIYLRRRDLLGEDVTDFAGLYRRSPWAAVAMAVFLLSLAGIPPTAGFMGKLILFSSAIKAELWLVAVVGVAMTAVSVYFYFRIVVQMFMKEPRDETPYAFSWELAWSVAVALAATVLIGVWPKYFIDLAQRSILQIPTSVLTLTQHL